MLIHLVEANVDLYIQILSTELYAVILRITRAQQSHVVDAVLPETKAASSCRILFHEIIPYYARAQFLGAAHL